MNERIVGEGNQRFFCLTLPVSNQRRGLSTSALDRGRIGNGYKPLFSQPAFASKLKPSQHGRRFFFEMRCVTMGPVIVEIG